MAYRTEPKARCLFCGHPTQHAHGFCTECWREGFYNVYYANGRRSDGWEWRERNAALLDRWNVRGRRVAFIGAITAKTYAHTGTRTPSASHPWRQWNGAELAAATA